MPEPLGLHTDLYELRMAETCLRHGLTEDATFSLYIRPDPERPWFLAAGVQQALEVLAGFSYGPEERSYLRAEGFSEQLLGWLGDLAPRGEVWAVPDGTVVLGDEPLLEVTAPLPAAMLWETALMNVVHHATLIATKAARCVLAAQGRPVADFGFRRAHGLAAGVEAARAAYLGGVASTSNVEAGRRFGIPVTGTMAHSLVQAWGHERTAFARFAEDHPEQAVLLVDTYDTAGGVAHAIEVGHELRARGHELAGVRLDSGDLGALAHLARDALDDAGFPDAKVIASGGLDEELIATLVDSGAPIDLFGVGTSMVISRDRPALDIVYKLVEHGGQPRAKYSPGKELLPGPKQVHRSAGPESDVLARRGEPSPGGEPLLAPVWRDGAALCEFDLGEARTRAAAQLEALPPQWRSSQQLAEPPRPRVSEALRQLAEQTRKREVAASAPGRV